jgi:hypothetical protein
MAGARVVLLAARIGVPACFLTACFLTACFLPEVQKQQPPTDAEVCIECASGSCQALYDACLANAACDALVGCALACPTDDTPADDAECISGCAEMTPDGVLAATELGACTDAECAGSCPTFGL